MVWVMVRKLVFLVLFGVILIISGRLVCLYHLSAFGLSWGLKWVFEEIHQTCCTTYHFFLEVTGLLLVLGKNIKGTKNRIICI
jgi:hypothetical protein